MSFFKYYRFSQQLYVHIKQKTLDMENVTLLRNHSL